MDVEGLARISGTTLEQAIPRVDELSRGHFVHAEAAESGVAYEISHPIFQEAIYESVGHARRQRLHQSVARHMLENGRLGEAASHFARAGDRSKEAVTALFEALRQASARELYQEALAVLKALLDVLPPMEERWVRLLESLTLDAEWVLSHLAEADADTAIDAMRRVIEVLEDTSDVGARALAQFHLAGFLCFGRPDLAAAEDACSASLRLFREAGDLDGELLARNELAWIRAWQSEYRSADDLARAAFEEAIRHDRTRVAIVAMATAAFVNGVMGRHGQIRELFDRTLELARGSGQSYRVAWALAQGGHYLALTGDLAEAVKWGEQSFTEHADAADAVAFEDLATTYWLQGDLEGAIELLDRSAIRRPILGSQRRAWGSALAARLHGESGRLGMAMARLESAKATYEHGLFIWSAWSRWSAGWLAWVNGDSDGALRQLDDLSTWLVDTAAWGYLPLVLADISEIAADQGRADACIRVAQCSASTPEEARTPLWRSVDSLISARADLANGQESSAVEQAAFARDRFENAGYGLLAASASQVLGEAIALSDRSEAISHLQDAASEFDAQNAVHRRNRVLTLLHRMGGRGRRAVAKVHGPGSLTPRELEVASLSAQGLTAHEVGERLFISKRTVETHLMNIYAKLGIDSKRELIMRKPELDL
jgi:ATP/maltotriose-dependent transcriptional regulator MalT